MADRVKLIDLVEDFTIYPRMTVDRQNVRSIRDAIAAGRPMAPIVVDRASKRIVDGVHRFREAKESDRTEIEVEWRDYPNEAALREDAMALNSSHGRRLSPWDIAHCIEMGKRYKIKAENLAKALGITLARLREIEASREARVLVRPGQTETVQLKRTVTHLVGTELRPVQAEGAAKCGGMMAIYYVNQVVNLLEHDLIDSNNEALAERLTHLARLLEKRLAVKA
jgi:hypothetical protein